LPEKTLKDIGGETMLARVVHRTERAKLINQIIVATTTDPADDAIILECKRLGVENFRGSEEDVLDRVYSTAKKFHTDIMVAITADSPLLDPVVTDSVIQAFLDNSADYADNSQVRTFPLGLDVQVVSIEALERAWREGKEFIHRVHVTPYIYQNPQEFKISVVKADGDYSRYRFTVDTEDDLAFVREIYKRFDNRNDFGWMDVIRLLEKEPQLTTINVHVKQKAIQEG